MRIDPRQFSNVNSIVRAIRKAGRQLAPPPDLKPSDWAESNIKIPVGNAIPGMIRFDNAPYQREPLNLTADPDCRRITLMWGAQVGKTQLALCGQAYRIAQNPGSQIMMQPSQGDLQTWLETKFNPMVTANKTLGELIAKPRGREGVNNQRMKSYPGGFLMFAWSGSPKTMRGRSAPFIVGDEIDGYDRTDEGNPISLIWQRAATFGDQRQLLAISTPTIKGESEIEKAFVDGDQRRFHIACPHCGDHQTLKWAQVVWDKNDDGEHLPETAGYCCEGCGVILTDEERKSSIRRAEDIGAGWKAEKPFRGHASFHLSELYSTFRKLSDIVQSFLEKKAANDMQTFVNVSLAETWEEEGEQVDSTGLMQRAEEYTAQVPAGAAILTAGIDMQNDRLEVEVVGWGPGEESWNIDYQVLWGDPLEKEVWEDLDEYLDQTFLHENGAQMSIAAACLDTGGTGGNTQAAYDYVKSSRRRRLFAIKGRGGWGNPVVSAPSRKQSGKSKRKINLFMVGVDETKVIVARRLGIAKPGPGYCHFNDERDPEFYQQMTAEKLFTRYVKGFPVREWRKTRDRNEAFDCRVYAYAALKIINPNLKSLLKKLLPEPEEKAGPTPENEEQVTFEKRENAPEEEKTGKRKTRRRIKGRARTRKRRA